LRAPVPGRLPIRAGPVGTRRRMPAVRWAPIRMLQKTGQRTNSREPGGAGTGPVAERRRAGRDADGCIRCAPDGLRVELAELRKRTRTMYRSVEQNDARRVCARHRSPRRSRHAPICDLWLFKLDWPPVFGTIFRSLHRRPGFGRSHEFFSGFVSSSAPISPGKQLGRS
jgi:hypothetical protein